VIKDAEKLLMEIVKHSFIFGTWSSSVF